MTELKELVCPSSSIACDGFHDQQQFIALIPESRYLDQYEILDVLIAQYFKAPRPYVPVSYTAPPPPIEPRKPRRIPKPPPLPEDWDTVGVTMMDFSGNFPETVRFSIPKHMSGWPLQEILAWYHADGHKDLEEAIIFLHEQGI